MANQQTAVTTAPEHWQPREVINLGDYDRSKFNVLIGGTFGVQMTPFLVPVARTYSVDPDPDHGEVYVQEWSKSGGNFVPKALGLSAVGLGNLANVAGILDIPQASGRVDDGRERGVVTYKATMAMRLPDGQWRVVTREYTHRLETLVKEIRERVEKKGRENKYNGKPEPWKPEKVEAEIRKESIQKERFLAQLAETGAKLRCYRAMLGIRSKYKPDEIARPFVLAAVVPDVNQPEVRERALDQATSAIGMLYGPGASDAGGAPMGPPRQIGPGALPPADAIAERDADAGGDEATPDELAALGLSAAKPTEDGDDDSADGGPAIAKPGWLQDGPAKAVDQQQQDDVDLATLLRDTAEASNMVGPAKDPQLETLRPLLQPLGGEVVGAAFAAVWGDDAVQQLTAAQAQALIRASRERDTFLEEFRQLAGSAAA